MNLIPRTPAKLSLASLLLAAAAALACGDVLAQGAQGPGVRQQGQDVPLGQPGTAQPGAPGAQDEELTDPRQQMRAFIAKISADARSASKNFVVVTIGGLPLLERVDPVDPTKRAPSATYIRTIDGVIAREINFHPPNERDETKTDEKVRAEKLRLAELGQRRGLRIWSLDYAKDVAMAQEAIRFAQSKSWVPFAAMDAEYRFARLPSFPSRPINENPDAITGLNHVRNFLMLTDTSAWDTQEEVALKLADTNYDALVLDVYHRGRTPFTPRTIDSLKYKKLGVRRLVLAYMNIGEADSFRYYWKPGWKEGSPAFIAIPTPTNPDKYVVQYWNKAWQDVITGNANSYLYGIVSLGFDGVVLDGVESYRAFEGEQ